MRSRISDTSIYLMRFWDTVRIWATRPTREKQTWTNIYTSLSLYSWIHPRILWRLLLPQPRQHRRQEWFLRYAFSYLPTIWRSNIAEKMGTFSQLGNCFDFEHYRHKHPQDNFLDSMLLFFARRCSKSTQLTLLQASFGKNTHYLIRDTCHLIPSS